MGNPQAVIRRALADIKLTGAASNLIYAGQLTVYRPGCGPLDDCNVYCDRVGNAYAIHNGLLVCIWPGPDPVPVRDPVAIEESLGRTLRRGKVPIRRVVPGPYGGVLWVQ